MNAPRRWPVTGLSTINAIFDGEDPCGIYVLEFENGESYVGQARDVRKRFYTHCRNSSHHSAWKDITFISFAAHPERDLNIREATVIRQLQAEGRKLRNRTMNLHHDQSSPLDKLIPPEDQFHWADSDYLDRDAKRTSVDEIARTIAQLPPEASKMSRLPQYEEALADIATFIDLVIPEPIATMEKYWTISDTPSTNGGRYFTINVGVLEMLRLLRVPDAPGFLNTLPWEELEDLGPDERLQYSLDNGMEVDAYAISYPKADVAFIEYECGRLRDLFESVPEVLTGTRALAVALMRTGTSGLFRRWHSKELTREAFMLLWEQRQCLKDHARG